jgi:hypothetical protein
MTGRLRAFAVLAGLTVSGVHCGGDPPPVPATAADVEPTPPPAPVAAPPPAPVQVAQIPHSTPTCRTRKTSNPVATLPGFELLPDGGSRLFVVVSKPISVEERRTQRVLTYVLKGTEVQCRNNENSLVTVHFNTPVTRARLLPSGRDLLFSVDLRADASPAWKVINGGDGTATVQIDFPPGSFLPANGVVDETYYGVPRADAVPPPPPNGPPPPAQQRRWRQASRQAPPPAVAVTVQAPAVAAPANAQPTPN